MEHKSEKSKEPTQTSSESKGVLGSVWSAAGAIAESVQHAVQGTIDAAYQTGDKIKHDAEIAGTVGGYMASKAYDKTRHTAESLLPHKTEVKHDPYESLSSPTYDMKEAFQPKEPSITKTATDTLADAKTKTGELLDSAKQTVSETVSNVTAKASEVYESAKQSVADTSASDLLASANKVANENIKAASENIQSTSDAAKDTVANAISSIQNLNLEKQQTPEKQGEPAKFELTMDIVAHLQRIADRTGDKILHETARKAHSACAKGQSDAPGVHLVRITPEQATELVNLAILTQDHELADFARYCQSVAATTQVGIEPSPGKIQEELNKGRQELSQQGRMHTGPGYGAAFASVGRVAPASATSATPSSAPASAPSTPAQQEKAEPSSTEMKLTMDMVAHIQRIADRTGDKVLHDTARKAHSACAKGLSEAPGVHLVSVTPDQASELVNLAIRTQDHELANFARYCQSVAATTQLGIEPTPGKILEEIAKGKDELQQQGRAHTGPGYGAAFASISRSNSAQNLGGNISRSNSAQSLGGNPLIKSASSRGSSPTNIPISPAPTQEQLASKPDLQLTMDVVAHLQRIADRTGDALLHETARRAHSACAKNVNEAPGVHLTWVTPEQATELVNLAIRTQDHELADFARYCQSVAATTQIGVEPSPGKIMEEIEKGRQELQQLGRSHTGPGYGAAFASKNAPKTEVKPEIKAETKIEPQEAATPSQQVGLPSQ